MSMSVKNHSNQMKIHWRIIKNQKIVKNQNLKNQFKPLEISPTPFYLIVICFFTYIYIMGREE